jgi:hypothetical protein
MEPKYLVLTWRNRSSNLLANTLRLATRKFEKKFDADRCFYAAPSLARFRVACGSDAQQRA